MRLYIYEFWNSFLATVSFFTRFYIPHAEHTTPNIIFYPLVGLLLGTLSTLPLYLLSVFFSIPSFLLAMFYILVQIYYTKGLHWDALADIADGVGSGKTGQEVWNIIKDSHIGAFGVLAIVCAMLLYLYTIEYAIQHNHFATLLYTPVLSRMCAGLLVYILPPPPHKGLASYLFSSKPSYTQSSIGVFLTVLLGYFLFNIYIAILCIALIIPTLYTVHIAKKLHGANGDIYGTALVLYELTILCIAMLFSL